MDVKNLDLVKIADIIIEQDYKVIALQFDDEYLVNCVDVYSALQLILQRLVPHDTIELYITADSSYGSSIDDVSAMHVNCQLIIMFGTDLSSSGTIPTIVAPFKKSYDVPAAVGFICTELQKTERKKNILLLSDLCHFHLLESTKDEVSACMDGSTVVMGQLPSSADLDNWSAIALQQPQHVMVGGLFVDASFAAISEGEGSDIDNTERVIVYIGEKEEQLQNILFTLSSFPIIQFNPSAANTGIKRFDLGLNSRELRARYGGISRVKDATVIGLLIGSMGLSQTRMQAILKRLEGFIAAAKKKCYVFVMGRLNEAKLCNFPEVNLFCLIGNDDNCYIPPKTFPVPVITPFELEIGLGARSWNAHLETLGDAAELSESEVSHMTGLIREFFRSPDDNDNYDEDQENRRSNSSDGVNEESNGANAIAGNSSSSSALVKTLKPEEQQLIDFKSSPAIEYFQNRQYQGLVSSIIDPADGAAAGVDISSTEEGVGHADSTLNAHGQVNIHKIHKGAVGIASKYER